MKVVFSSIVNGTSGDVSANEVKSNDSDSAVDKSCCFKPQFTFSQTKAESSELFDKSSQEAFDSLINASNCANLQENKSIEGYFVVLAQYSNRF